jgi:formamidopyrimidine-DNA glycosylase
MPELPEVETVARGVDARVRGRRVEEVWLGEKPEPLKSPAAVIANALTGARIARVHRVGKTIVFDLEERERGQAKAKEGNWRPSARQFLVHLGMTGRLLVNDAGVERAAHTHAVLSLDDGSELRFVDPRRFGRLAVAESGEVVRGAGSSKEGGAKATAKKQKKERVGSERGEFAGTGREPLRISAADFRALFRGRKTAIKAALLNQSLLHGVGNIYADEGLFRAGVRPARQAARVTAAELERLRVGLVAVLKAAIKKGGSSVSDYVDAEGARGFFQLEHNVYQRAGEPCRVCGATIKRIVVGGRSTHYCGVCQR